MSGPCTRCDQPGRHVLHIGGQLVVGWELLCCACSDQFMRVAGSTVSPAEQREGWDKWLYTHAAECGPLTETQDFFGRATASGRPT